MIQLNCPNCTSAIRSLSLDVHIIGAETPPQMTKAYRLIYLGEADGNEKLQCPACKSLFWRVKGTDSLLRVK
jgi:hypothetical protein